MMHYRHGVPIASVATCLLATVGCSSGDGSSTSAEDRQARIVMNVVSVFYGEYLESHQGKPPQDAAALVEFMKSRPEDLQRYNVESPDQLMTSPRDGQPLVIVCGKPVAPQDSPGTPWAAYEQTGINGTKMAVQVRGGVHELSADEIALTFE